MKPTNEPTKMRGRANTHKLPSESWDDLINLAKSHKAGTAPPLTSKQLTAIHQLVPIRQMRSQPQLGGEDWVSLLYKYRDSTRRVVGIDFQFVETAAKRFSCTVTLVMHQNGPLAGGPGVDADTIVLPDAQTMEGYEELETKKQAKQWAAKCAVDWLARHGHLDANEDGRPDLKRKGDRHHGMAKKVRTSLDAGSSVAKGATSQ